MNKSVALACVPFLVACSDGTAPDGSPVELRVAAVTSGTAVAGSGADIGALASSDLVLPAAGGAYVVDDVRVIVSELELEGPEICPEAEAEQEIELDECEFEVEPMMVLSLPLNGGELSIGTGFMAEGTYTSFELEVEDVDLEDEEDVGGEDQATQEAAAAALAELQSLYPGFPADASMVIHGWYTPDAGDPVEFTVYGTGEVEVEMPLDPPLIVPDDAALTIQIDPGLWLAGLDLVALDGQTFEIDVEIGFAGVEIEQGD